MPSRTLKRTSKPTSVSSKKTSRLKRKPEFAYVRPLSGTLTEEEADRIVIEAGGREITPAERRKYSKILKEIRKR